MFDVASHIGATARVVEDRTHDGEPVRVVIASRAYDTTVEDLWDAVTNPERLPRWFAPVEGELKLGGRYQVKGNAGGTVLACEPPKSYALTWEFGGGVSWVNVAIRPARDGAHLTLEHLAPINDHWKKFGPGAVGIGWELGLLGLAMYLSNPNFKDGFDENAFGASPEGKAFIRGSGEGWIAADIASGEGAPDATTRGQRTISFFSGEPFE